MIQVNYNKPRSATQQELEELFAYELEQRCRANPDYQSVKQKLEQDLLDASVVIWDGNENWRGRMVVLWGQEHVSFYAWYDSGFARIEMYETEMIW